MLLTRELNIVNTGCSWALRWTEWNFVIFGYQHSTKYESFPKQCNPHIKCVKKAKEFYIESDVF